MHFVCVVLPGFPRRFRKFYIMENFENIFKTICRICLSYGNSGNMVCLTDNAADDGLSSYGKAVLTFTNISVKTECLPDKMCAQCCSVLEQAIMFKRTCENTNEKLTKFMHNLDSLDTQAPDFKEKFCEYVLFMDSNDCLTEFSNELSEISKESCSYLNTEIEETEAIKNEDEKEYHSDTEMKKEEKDSDEESDRWDFENDSLHDIDDNEENSKDEKQPNEMQEEDTANCSTGRPKRKAAKKRVFTYESESDECSDTDNHQGEESQALNVQEKEASLIKGKKIQRKIIYHSESDESRDKEYHPGNNSHTSSDTSDEDLRVREKIKKSKPYQKPTFIPCKICMKPVTKGTMPGHLLRHDDSNRRFVCDQCGKKFFVLKDVQSHAAGVHGLSPWVCKTCGYKASDKYNLIEHDRLHNGERPFKCDKCELTFSRRGVFRNHKKLHMEKTIQCPQCPKKFHTKYYLSCHFNSIHHRSRMYACSHCNVTYASDVSIRKHLTEVHGISKQYRGNFKRIELGIPPEVKEILGKK